MSGLAKQRTHGCKTWDQMDFQTLPSLIKLCSSVSDGILLHTLIVQSPLHTNRFLCNLLIDMYGQCGALEDALATFFSIPVLNVFSWNLIIRTCTLNGHADYALSLFDKMLCECVAMPDRVTFLSALAACSRLKDLREARRLEACIAKSNGTADLVIQSAIINMYYKCGSLEDAERIFNSVQEQDVVCWNTMIAAYSQLGHDKKALALFEMMMHKRINPSSATYSTLFSFCAKEGFLTEGRQLHASLKNHCLTLDLASANALISMYGRCDSVKEAYDIFDSMLDRDLVTWSAMMSAYVNCGSGKQAIQLFHQMRMEDMIADATIITNVICACASEFDVSTGKRIHACVMLASDVIVLTAFVSMYGKCQCIAQAQNLFDELTDRDVIAHNAMISAFSRCGLQKEAIQHFEQMQMESVLPGRATYTSVLDACSATEGVFMHTHLLNAGFSLDNEVSTALIAMYGRHGNLEKPELILAELHERDVIVWNAMISVCSQLKQYEKAFYYFQQLQVEGFMPTAATFACSLSACVTQVSLMHGKHMHTFIVGALLDSDVVAATALVNMYGKCGNLELAQSVFDALPGQISITWNALVAAYAQHGHSEKVLDLFNMMLAKGIRIDHAGLSSVLSACSRTGYVDEGVQCFISLLQGHGITPSVQHYNCLIDLVSRSGRVDEGESILSLMPSSPIDTSWTALLSACIAHVDVERGERIADTMMTLVPESNSISMLMTNISMLAKRHAVNDG